MGEVAEIGTGSHDTKDALADGQYDFYARGVEVLKLNVYDHEGEAIVTAGDGAGVGKVIHYVNGKYALHQRAYRICPNRTVVDGRYLYHYFTMDFYGYIMKRAVSSSVVSIRRKMLDNYPIPLPSVNEQVMIASKLDKLETTSEGMLDVLRNEIGLHEARLVEFRNQLLTFPEKVA